jgi:hypothetical protein
VVRERVEADLDEARTLQLILADFRSECQVLLWSCERFVGYNHIEWEFILDFRNVAMNVH